MLVKKYRLRLLAVLVVISMLSACSSSKETTTNAGDSKKTIVLKGATAWEENNIHSAGFGLFKKKLEALSNGRITIQYAGGPESIPAFNQGEAVRNGVIDFSVISASYYSNQMPEAAVVNYSELPAEEEWKSGAMNFLNEIHNKKLNAQLLGRASNMRYSIYLKSPIKNISDLKGKRIRTSPAYVPFMKALGAEAVIMPAGEIYTAIERGVIDGVAWPEDGITDLSLEKQVKYQILPTYWQVDTVIIMNLDKWKQLSKEDQDLINKAAREIEKDLSGEIAKYTESEQKKLKEAGLQQIQLPAQEYEKIANDAAWEFTLKNSPENGQKLQELFRKK